MNVTKRACICTRIEMSDVLLEKMEGVHAHVLVHSGGVNFGYFWVRLPKSQCPEFH
jgi:hypothetical protein